MDLGQAASRASSTFQALPSFSGPNMGQFNLGPINFNQPNLPSGTGFGAAPQLPSMAGPRSSLGQISFTPPSLGPINFNGFPSLPNLTAPMSNLGQINFGLPGMNTGAGWQLNGDGTNHVAQNTNPVSNAVNTVTGAAKKLVSGAAGAKQGVLNWMDQINAASQKWNVPADVIAAVMDQESSGDPNALSPKGAIGLMQLMPKTAFGLGVSNPNDPASNIDGGAKYLQQLYHQYGDWNKALVAYNAGSYDPNASYNGVSAGDYAAAVQAVRNKYVTTSTADPNSSWVNNSPGVSVKGQDLSPNQFQSGEPLTAAEAAAACGPTAAVALSRALGRNPTLEEAITMAKTVGWSPAGGMAGITSESMLLDKMNVPHTTVGDTGGDLDQSRMQVQIGNGKPVVVSGPEHYMTITDYNPNTGQYYAGTSGAVSSQRSAWLNYSQLKAAAGGSFNGAIYLQ